MGLGRISPTLPYIKKEAMELLKANYASNEEAARTIPVKLAGFYRDTLSRGFIATLQRHLPSGCRDR